MPAPTDPLAVLRRHPDVDAPNLHAVDAADRLLLDEAGPALASATPGGVSVIGDRYGALTLGAVVRHGTSGVRTHQDRLTGERALAANAERLGVTGTFRSLPLGAELLAGARVVLLQLPRSLDALDEIAEVVAAHADPDALVLAGGRLKHMTPAMNHVLARHLGPVAAGPARQKARVLRTTGPRPAPPGRDVRAWPASTHHGDLGVTVVAHGGVFAGTGIDLGTRLLLALVEPAAGAVRAVDLGCGSGVLATVLALRHERLQVVATDESAAAVASARATTLANHVGDRVTVVRDDGAATLADGGTDLVVLNPPFHVGAAVHAGAAHRLFADAARVLRPGGELWAVWNSHLRYRSALEAAVGPTRQVARDNRFTVTVSTRAPRHGMAERAVVGSGP